MFKKTLKRAMSLLLVAVLVVSAIPTLSVVASAGTGSPESCSTPGIINLYWPTGKNYYGITSDPSFYRNIDGSPRWHAGLDIPVGEGTPVYAVADGTVVSAYNDSAIGYNIAIKHTNLYNGTVYSKYFHLSSIVKYSGDVKAGQLIGYSGATGSVCYGAHLHFEFRRVANSTTGVFINPNPAKETLTFKWCTEGYDKNYQRGPFNYVKDTSLVGPILGKATITNGASFHPGDVTFTWNAATGATSYNLKIWRLNSDRTETQICNATGVKSGYTYNLKDGNYRYVVQAVNSSGYTETEANLYVGKEFIPSSYFFYNGNLYEIYESTKSWDDAKAFCEGTGGHLATITSQEEQDIIESHIQNSQNHYLWLGASDTEVERTFKWVTGEPFSYANWDTLSSKEPNDSSPGEDYVAIKTVASVTDYKGSWNDAATSCRYGFICEYDNIDDMEPSATTTYNGHAYDLYDYKLPAIQAELFAQRNGGHLVSLNSAEEEDAVEELMAQGSKAYYWLGATKFDVDTYEYHDKFVWTTGEAVTYENFGDGEPNNSGGEEWFVEYVKDIEDYIAWNDVCNIGRKANTSGFIVEKPVEYTITYDFCDGINGPENQTKLHGETIRVSEIIPEKEGFTFLGWTKNKDSLSVDYLPGDIYTIEENIVLYAVWQAMGDITGISVSSLPDKTTYKLGETFDYDGLSVTVEYSTGITQTIDKDFVLTGFDSDTVGDKTIIVSYGDKTVDFKVSVEFDTAWSDWILADELPDTIKNAPEGLYEFEYVDGYSTSTLERKNSGYASEEGWILESKTKIGSTASGDWGLDSVKTSNVQSETYHTVVTSESVQASACHAFVTSDKRTYWFEDTSEYGSTKYTQHIYIYSSKDLPSTGYSLDKDNSGNVIDGSYVCPKTIGVDNPDKFGEVYLIVDRYNKSNPNILNTFTSGKDVAYWWPVDGKTTLYRSVTEQYQYTHVRWTDWSEMSMDEVEPTDSVKVNVTENAYVRYRLNETTVNNVYDTIDKINAIPDEVSMNEKVCVLSAQAAYNTLRDFEKAYISQSMVDKLNDAVEALGNANILTFTINSTNSGYIVTDCASNYVGDIEIPDEIDGLPVTAIGTDAFRDCIGINSVVIPDSVTSIGGSAFRGCTNLTGIDLPDNITSIPGAMCYGCTKLETVIIPEGVVNIGGYAFGGCTSLENAVIPESVTNIGGSVFTSCKSLIVFCSKNSTADTYATANAITCVFNTVNTKTDLLTQIIYTDVLGGDLSEIISSSDSVTYSMNTAYAGTGAVVDVMKDGTLHSQFTLVVNGDTNGDSVCDVLDCFDVERTANGNGSLSGVFAEAGDTNSDGIIDITDYQAIVNKAVS